MDTITLEQKLAYVAKKERDEYFFLKKGEGSRSMSVEYAGDTLKFEKEANWILPRIITIAHHGNESLDPDYEPIIPPGDGYILDEKYHADIRETNKLQFVAEASKILQFMNEEKVPWIQPYFEYLNDKGYKLHLAGYRLIRKNIHLDSKRFAKDFVWMAVSATYAGEMHPDEVVATMLHNYDMDENMRSDIDRFVSKNSNITKSGLVMMLKESTTKNFPELKKRYPMTEIFAQIKSQLQNPPRES